MKDTRERIIFLNARRGLDRKEGGAQRPHRTLYSAMEAAKRFLRNEDETHVRILVSEGSYNETKTSVLKGKDIGNPHSTLSIEGINKSVLPVFSAVHNISGKHFRPSPDGSCSFYEMQKGERRGARFPAFYTLYMNGDPCEPAEYPSKGVLLLHKEDDSIVFLEAAHLKDIDPEKHPLTLRIYGMDRIDTVTVKERVSLPCPAGYTALRLSEESLLRTDAALRFSWHRCYYTLCGHPALLNAPSTYLYDRAAGRIFYRPQNAYLLSTSTVSYPVLETLIAMDSVAHITLKDLMFTGLGRKDVCSLEGALSMNGCRDVLIENCTFRAIDTHALRFTGSTERLCIKSSEFTSVGGSAILVCGDRSSGIRITDNLFSSIGSIAASPAICMERAESLSILRNTLSRIAGCALSLGDRRAENAPVFPDEKNLYNTEIAYNRFENFLTAIFSGAALEAYGKNAPEEYLSYFNTVHHNLFQIGPATAGGTGNFAAVALKNSATHFHVYDNLVFADPFTPPNGDYVFSTGKHCLSDRTDVRTGKEGLSDESADILKNAGALPEKVEESGYRHRITVFLDAENGDDLNKGTRADKPIATLKRAFDVIKDILSTKAGVDITVSLSKGVHPVDATLILDVRDFITEKYTLAFVAREPGHVAVESTARNAFRLTDISNVLFQGIAFHSRNASLGSVLFDVENGHNISFSCCEFSRINANAIRLTGATRKVSIDKTQFSHLGGNAITVLPLTNTAVSAEEVTVSACVFDSIGYVFHGSPAIAINGASRVFLSENRFRALSHAAISIDCCRKTVIADNAIEDFSTAASGAALSICGGSESRESPIPQILVLRNSITASAASGGESGEYAMFSMQNASHIVLRSNQILPRERHPSPLPLLNISKNSLRIDVIGNTVFDNEDLSLSSVDGENKVHFKNNARLPYSERENASR